MNLKTGLYEQLINKLISNKLDLLESDKFYIHKLPIDRQEASRYLSLYLAETIRYALNEIKGEERVIKQIELSNKVIQLLIQEFDDLELTQNLIDNEAKILHAVFSKLDFPYANIKEKIKEIKPYTGLSQSELFTGNHVGISMESEIRKEILSSDEICWLVSFIKFSGIRIFKEELKEFTNSGRKLKIITTSYMGATDLKAVEFLSSLPNTEVRISYNADHERLHAKAYLFLRNTGFHTGYIGSSNISRSALTNGLEWNVKVTTREIGHIIDKFRKTFETYWEDNEFEYYRCGQDKEKLSKSLRVQKNRETNGIITFFDLKPFPFQEEIIAKLLSERKIHNRFRNLLVAATGTGKTIISAFDFKRFKEDYPAARLLFVAHKKEILEQARKTFQHVLLAPNFGDLWVDGQDPVSFNQLFASVQTLRNRLETLPVEAEFFDFIVIDEVHHIAASSYRPILQRFNPKILLGLTATPERMDGEDILTDFCNVVASEIRLPEALNRKLLCPFQYFGISDSIDISRVGWKNGKYEIRELSRLYTEDDRRVGEIIKNCEKYLTDVQGVRALGFCVNQKHARYMAEKFILAGIKADYLTSENSTRRSQVREKLQCRQINYLFVVDIFNEGIDIPEIDTMLFLRPTESLTVFLQQLGRGLRLAPNKECLTVLDFVGNARSEYDFEQKFRALVGKTHTGLIKEIEDEFPHLPLGCSIILEKKAKSVILNNIRTGLDFRRPQLLGKIKSFKHQSLLPLTLKNFLTFNHLELPQLYRKGSWKRLCADAGVLESFHEPEEEELTRLIHKKLFSAISLSYLRFIKELILQNFVISNPSDEEAIMLIMFHYDVWQDAGPALGFRNIEESLGRLSKNPVMMDELMQAIDLLISGLSLVEKDINLGFAFPLRLHGRYNRDQILAALRLHTFEKASSNREGVAFQKELNTEVFFVTLKKSEKEYSPTTLYNDYAISESLFHWQSQNSTTPGSKKGKSYIEHRILGKRILLFVREQNKDEYGLTMSYVFLGEANFVKYNGSKPMNIEWLLQEPMPAYLWKEGAKLAVG